VTRPMTLPPPQAQALHRQAMIEESIKTWRAEGILTEAEIQKRALGLADEKKSRGIQISMAVLDQRHPAREWLEAVREAQARSRPGVESDERDSSDRRRIRRNAERSERRSA
jgi:hypothetical protein